MYHFIVDDRSIENINKTGYFQQRVDEAGVRSKMTFTCSNNVFARVYSTMICRIYILLYSYMLSIKLLKVFDCKQDEICGDDIYKSKFLPFS